MRRKLEFQWFSRRKEACVIVTHGGEKSELQKFKWREKSDFHELFTIKIENLSFCGSHGGEKPEFQCFTRRDKPELQ